MIDTEKLNQMFLDCFPAAGVGKEVLRDKSKYVVVQGISARFGFDKAKLAAHAPEVRSMLEQLPVKFRPASEGGGGGASFLEMPLTEGGEQWGEHINCEQLLSLALGLGWAEYCLPREMWSALPGGMPYVALKEKA